MIVSITNRRRLAMASVCLVALSVASAPAWAQKIKNKDVPAAQTSVPQSDQTQFSIDIPTIDAENSNVDIDTLRDILSGDLINNAAALAGLTADSISVPEIIVSGSSTVDGEATEYSVTFTDLELADVANGVAASVSLGSISTDGSEDMGSAQFGSATASDVDIGGVLRLYGVVEGNVDTGFSTIYSDFAFEGGTVTAPELECTIGAMAAGEFRARPLAYSFSELMTLAASLEDVEDNPDPKQVGDLMRMYADLLTAYETSPATFDGFSCSGVDEMERPIDFSVAGLTIGGWTPGVYPVISMDGLNVAVEGDGLVSVGNATFKQMDLSGPIATIKSAPESIDDAWLEANLRGLIPAFEGFSLSDIDIDVVDPEMADQRIVASIGMFDLTLLDYINGVPTDLSTSASNVVVKLPATSEDPQLQQLLALGLDSIDMGFAVKASWDAAENQIDIEDISVTGADLATVKLTGTLANVSEAVFGLDIEAALAASMEVVLADLKLDIADAGLSDLVVQLVASEQGGDAQTMRTVYAGLAQGTVISLLAGAAEAQKVGAAINSFVSGKASHLVIELTAKEQPGLGLSDFMAAEQDPSVLIDKVTIDATAK